MKSVPLSWLLLFAFWAMTLYEGYSLNSPYFLLLLFFSSIHIAIHFLLKLVKRKVLFYFFVLGGLQLLMIVAEPSIRLCLFVLFLFHLMEMSIKVAARQYKWIVVCIILVEVVFNTYFFSYPLLFWISINVLVGLFLYYVNEWKEEYHHIREAYESLIFDYRIQKRESFQNEKAARIEERNIIARNMHDSVGHKLTALIMQIELISMKEKEDSLKLLKKMAGECLEETRKAVRLLQVEEIHGIASVIHLIKKLESENNIHVYFTTKQGVLKLAISNRISAVLYRSIQEGITNAMKYGSSKEVYVILGVSPIHHLTFEIKNAYHHKHPIHLGFGLENMTRRIEELDGMLQIYQQNQQFILQGSMPVGRDEE